MSTQLSSNLPWELANNIWAQSLNPIIAIPMLSGKAILNFTLINGVTKISHGLGRMMQGWQITDINGAATIYRSAPLNSSTLTLTSNAIVVVSLWVF